MTNAQFKQQLERDLQGRRERLETIRRDLRGATARLKSSGDSASGRAVTELAEAERVANIALDGALETLARFNQRFQPVTAPGARAGIEQQRAEVIRKRDYRHAERAEQVELVRKRCAGMPEHHVQAIINQHFGSTEHMRRQQDQDDADRVALFDAQLGNPPTAPVFAPIAKPIMVQRSSTPPPPEAA